MFLSGSYSLLGSHTPNEINAKKGTISLQSPSNPPPIKPTISPLRPQPNSIKDNPITNFNYSFITMHSISIVYRKERPLQPPKNHAHKRSVDEYYTRLLEKEKHMERINSEKKQLLERIKLRTSSNHRRSDKFNILQTLNIVPLALQQPTQEKREELKILEKMYVSRKLELSRPTLKGISFAPMPVYPYPDEDEAYQTKMHNKLKCLFKQKQSGESKDTILALSLNFILNQHNFWNQQQIDEPALRVWRKLQEHAQIVWLCHRQQSLKKLLRFSKLNDCRLDGVYLLMPRKRNLLTVAFHTIENDFGVRFHKSGSPLPSKEERKLIVVQGLEVDSVQRLGYKNFYYAVPIIRNLRSIVHYAKIDTSDKLRFGTVLKILSQEQRPEPFDLMRVIQEYEEKGELQQPKETEYDECVPPDLLSKMEEVRKEFTKYFAQSLSVNLNEKVSYENSQNSGMFLIGDILRRNYKIYQQYHRYASQYQSYLQTTHARQARDTREGREGQKQRAKASFNLKKYRNEVYVWEL